MRCEYCPIEQGYGNRTFDCVRLAKFYCEFDYVRLSSAIERLVFDWVRLPNCSIRYAGTFRIPEIPVGMLMAHDFWVHSTGNFPFSRWDVPDGNSCSIYRFASFAPVAACRPFGFNFVVQPKTAGCAPAPEPFPSS